MGFTDFDSVRVDETGSILELGGFRAPHGSIYVAYIVPEASGGTDTMEFYSMSASEDPSAGTTNRSVGTVTIGAVVDGDTLTIQVDDHSGADTSLRVGAQIGGRADADGAFVFEFDDTGAIAGTSDRMVTRVAGDANANASNLAGAIYQAYLDGLLPVRVTRAANVLTLENLVSCDNGATAFLAGGATVVVANTAGNADPPFGTARTVLGIEGAFPIPVEQVFENGLFARTVGAGSISRVFYRHSGYGPRLSGKGPNNTSVPVAI